MNPRIFALLTARAGSKSIPDKNIMQCHGMPLFFWNVLAAEQSELIEKTFISTDSQFIKTYSSKYEVIDRPEDLCQDTSSHHETIIHGIEQIEEREKCRCDIVVVLLGNANGATADDIDYSILRLMDIEEIDSVLSVSEFNMFNPFRAFKKTGMLLETVVPQNIIMENSTGLVNNKDAAGNCYFFNGAFMTCRRDVVFRRKGKAPFAWLGDNIAAHYMDTTMEIDAPWQLSFLK